MKYDFTAIEKKWQKKWLEGEALHRRHRRQDPGEVLRPHRVPLPLRPGAPRGPRPALHRHGHHLPEEADAGLQRPVPHRVRRLRPAHGELRRPAPHPPCQGGPTTTSRTSASSCTCWAIPSTGTGGQHHRPQLLQVDPVDLPADVQARPGLQGLHARQLVHQLQDRPGQ